MPRCTVLSVTLASVLLAAWLGGPGTPYTTHMDAVSAVRASAPGEVVVLGDSIAWNLARLAGHTNAGLPGDTTAGVLWRLDHGAMPARGTPVVLVIGTNDALHGRAPADIAADTLAIVDALTAAGCGVLVVTEIPRGPDGVHPDRAGYAELAVVAGL